MSPSPFRSVPAWEDSGTPNATQFPSTSSRWTATASHALERLAHRHDQEITFQQEDVHTVAPGAGNKAEVEDGAAPGVEYLKNTVVTVAIAIEIFSDLEILSDGVGDPPALVQLRDLILPGPGRCHRCDNAQRQPGNLRTLRGIAEEARSRGFPFPFIGGFGFVVVVV
jgi:hypothetical protein